MFKNLPKAADAYAQSLKGETITPHYTACVNNIIGAIKNKDWSTRCSEHLSQFDIEKLKSKGYGVHYLPPMYRNPEKGDPVCNVVYWIQSDRK